MALNPVNPIQSASATATNGSPTVTVTGNVDCSFVVPGFLLQIGTRRVVAAISGTAPVSGTSTITLASNWDQTTTTDKLIGWNSIESLPNLINRQLNALSQQTAIGELSSNGVLEKIGANTYQTFPVTAAGKALLDDADAAAQRATLGLGNAATATTTTSAADTTTGRLWRTNDLAKQTSTTDNTAGRMLAVGAFGLGATAQTAPSNDLNLITVTGFYTTTSATLNRPSDAPTSGNTVIHIAYSSTAFMQLMIFYGDVAKIRTRRWNGTVWSAWGPPHKNDFGLGSHFLGSTTAGVGNLPPSNDIALIVDSGFYGVTSATLNTPALTSGNSTSNAALLAFCTDPDDRTFIFIARNTAQVFYGKIAAGGAITWAEMPTDLSPLRRVADMLALTADNRTAYFEATTNATNRPDSTFIQPNGGEVGLHISRTSSSATMLFNRSSTAAKAWLAVENAGTQSPWVEMLTEGSFGFGGIAPALTGANALDNVVKTGFLSVASANVSAVNGPLGANSGIVETMVYGSLPEIYIVQKYHAIVGVYRSWTRQRSGGWGPWVEDITGYNVKYLQNTSGAPVAPNATIAGSALTPAQTGTWRCWSTVEVPIDGYSIWSTL